MNRVDAGVALPGYRVVECLGEGASGVVYKARQLSTGQWVAIKLLRLPRADETVRARRVARFLRETRFCAQLHHPHVVRLLDQGQTEGAQLVAVFEFVPGETLRELLQREGALPAPLAGELMGQVLDALVEAHAKGIVHRDLKPPNIMVTRHGEQLHAKVLDFGIGALAADLMPAEATELTLSTETLGTPRYSAPEQLRGEPPTVKSDLYAWGLILLECLTGAPAVRGQTLAEIYHQHLSPAELALPAALLRHPLGELLRRVLRKQARERRGDTSAVYADFREIALHGLVGRLADEPAMARDGDAETRATAARTERRQITMLCFALELAAPPETAPGDAALEAMEELLGDQLALCGDACLAFGGHAAGALGSVRLVYFGYPQASDGAARCAARAALDLVSRCRERSRRLAARDGLRLQLRAALHTGLVLVRPGRLPSGLAAAAAERLLREAAPDSILVSEAARGALDRHCILDATPLAFAMDDARVAPVWALRAERDASVRHAGEAAPAASALIGRAGEAAALAALWQRAVEGRGAALMVLGDPGLGKSRLLQALCERVRDDRGEAWVLHCLPEQRHSALHPFLRWVVQQFKLDAVADPAAAAQRLAAELGRLGAGGAEAAAVLANWLALPAPPGSPALVHSPRRQRELVLDTLRGLLRAASCGPALLVVEDVHWADPTSREFIDALLPELGTEGHGGRALCVVLSARPGMDYRPPIETMQLQGLASAESEQLLRSVPGAHTLAAADVAQMVARADGNPFFLAELARAALDRPAALVPRGEAPGKAPGIPPSLREVLGLALDRLGPARETAQLAAAIGREFEPSLLVQAAARDESTVQGDLEQMFLAEIVARQRSVHGDAYVFRHALIRDAAYESMTAAARVQTHGRIALALESAGAATLAPLAWHCAHAGRYEHAVGYGLRAAGQSLGRGLYEEALGQTGQMEAWIEALPDAVRRVASLDASLLATQALMSKLGWADPRVRAGAERSQALLQGLGVADDAGRRAAALWALATFHHVASERAQMRSLAQQLAALAAAAGGDVLPIRRAAHTLQGIGQWIDGDYRKAAASLAQASALPAADGDADAARFGLDCRCWSLAALANVRWFADDDRESALALAADAVAQAELLGHMPTLGLCLMYQAFLHQHDGDPAAAAATCARLLGLSRRYGLPAVEAYAAAVDCWVRGDAAGLAAILGRLQAMGCLLGQTYVGSLAADAQARAGDLDAALRRVERCLAQADASGERYYLPELLRQQADLLLRCGGAAAAAPARSALAAALAQARRLGMARSEREALHQLQNLPDEPRAGQAAAGSAPFPSPTNALFIGERNERAAERRLRHL
jgi:TOMM system kinase/cyclase fusion protein